MKKFYHLLFYKIFKLGSLVRPNDNAALVSSLLLGFIMVFSIFRIIGLLQVVDHTSEFLDYSIYIASMLINLLYFMRKGKYRNVITEIESTKPTLICNIMVYLFLCWSLIGGFL